MHIAITGATGFLGRHLVDHLAGLGHSVRCWYRPGSDRGGFEPSVAWVPGELGQPGADRELVEGCDAVVHSALARPGAGFMGAEGDVPAFAETNVIGTLRLIEAARAAGVGRFVALSTCAVHDVIVADRPLDDQGQRALL